ncbi:MAG: sigma-70 family RNA polymerase sigma factor [Candidatus Nanopelagicales bacterium]|nr:sigma-70 family RNA polymerase sigma factor [Candidatus Nanopelagicales bacterium]
MTPTESGPLSDADRRAAFAQYVEPELPVLLRVARTLTSSEADAEDLVQETVIRAYRALEGFDGAHPRAWLLTIQRHTASNLRRRTRPDLVDDWAVLADPKPAFGAHRPETPHEAVATHVLDDDLEQAIDSLGEKFRPVLVMVDVHGLTYAECAQALGIPIGTVMSRLNRARDRLRKHLKASGRLT